VTQRRYLPPRDHLAAIGAVAVVWTAIESIVETTILGLYEIDLGRGLVLTANLSVPAKLSLLRILDVEGAIDNTGQAEEMKALLSRVETASGERNTIVHGLWKPAATRGVVKRLSIRTRGKKLQYTAQNYSAVQLWAIADGMAELLAELADLGQRLGIAERLDAAARHSTASK
jgi:hypothetical protein